MTQLQESMGADVLDAAGPDGHSATLAVGVVGLGYVGLPSAIALIEGAAEVVGLDANPARLAAIQDLRVDLSARDLMRLSRAVDRGSLTLTADPALLAGCDAVIICVPTPVDEHLTPDLDFLDDACRAVVAAARPGQTLVLTSTSYVGTTEDMLVRPLQERGLRVGTDVFVAFSPERIDPGNDRFDHIEVPRVVGGKTTECSRRAAEVLQMMTSQVHVVSSPETAELTKLYENTFRAVNIALVNEIADISGELSVQVTEVIDAAATKPFGFMPFAPGPGVGGHCIPCDPHYLLWQLRSRRIAMPLVESAMRGIAARPTHIVNRVREELADNDVAMRGANVVVVGVAYKPGVEDIRESPALEIISRLRQLGAQVSFVDPLVRSISVDGEPLEAAEATELLQRGPIDLAVLHTRHPDAALDWLALVPTVLDATYRAFDVSHRVAV
jgi:nucleotide sugar dehydrogenase